MRYFGIVFDGGFALAHNTTQLAEVITNHSNVEVNEYETPERAYFSSAQILVKREYWRTPYMQFPLPTIKNMVDNSIFQMMNYVGYYNPPTRFFAATSKDYVGILDNVNALIAFLEQVPFVEVKECNDPVNALHQVNFSSLQYILPLGAYIEGNIDRYSSIPVNTIVPSIFKNWQDKVRLPSGISPQEYLPAPIQESITITDYTKPDSQS